MAPEYTFKIVLNKIKDFSDCTNVNRYANES